MFCTETPVLHSTQLSRSAYDFFHSVPHLDPYSGAGTSSMSLRQRYHSRPRRYPIRCSGENSLQQYPQNKGHALGNVTFSFGTSVLYTPVCMTASADWVWHTHGRMPLKAAPLACQRKISLTVLISCCYTACCLLRAQLSVKGEAAVLQLTRLRCLYHPCKDFETEQSYFA